MDGALPINCCKGENNSDYNSWNLWHPWKWITSSGNCHLIIFNQLVYELDFSHFMSRCMQSYKFFLH